jgi:hypothetical protein
MASGREPTSRSAEPVRTRALAPPSVLTPERRQAILERAKARKEREERMAKYERLIRSHQRLSDTDFKSWLDACDAEDIDAKERWQWLTRPLSARLADLFADPPRGWPKANDPPPKDKILSPDLIRLGVLDNPKADAALAECVTYLEDARDDTRRWRGTRTTWKVSEAERGDAIATALDVVVAEGVDYVLNLTGDAPRTDRRIAAVLQHLVAIDRLLRKATRDRAPRAKVGRPRIGPNPYWSRRIAKGISERLTALYELRDADHDSEEDRTHVLQRLLDKMVRRLHLADRRGVGGRKILTQDADDTKAEVIRDPQRDLLLKLRKALGRQRLPAQSRTRSA